MKIVTAAEMRKIDRITSERFGVPSVKLMENAGKAVAHFILQEFADDKRILVVCGKGNNGGDGFVAARWLSAAGKKVKVLLIGNPQELQGDAAQMYRRLKLKPAIAESSEALHKATVKTLFDSAELIVDALLGTGFKPPLKEPYRTAIRLMNEGSATVVSVDVPSGSDSDSHAPNNHDGSVKPDAVVTFTAPKAVNIFRSDLAVPTIVAPIGTPDPAVTSERNLNVITVHDLPSTILVRAPDAHKGDFGHALVVGGSLGKGGAAAMAGMASLRVGAGLTTVATPKSVLSLVAGFAPELMTEALDEDETDAGFISTRASAEAVLKSLLSRKTVLAVGPGLSRNPQTAEFVRNLVDRCSLPLVVDADALNAFEGHGAKLKGSRRPLVLTPHPGEMARLSGLSISSIEGNRIEIAREFAQQHELILVLKGWRTLIAEPQGEVWVNTTGNPGMAKGGSGDVLSGMIAGLIAQLPKDIRGAVRAAVYLHGLAGDFAQSEGEAHSMVATDILNNISYAFEAWRQMVRSPVVGINPCDLSLRRAASYARKQGPQPRLSRGFARATS